MKARLTLLLTMAGMMLFASPAWAYDVQLMPYKDEEKDYALDPIYTLAAVGIINGYEDRTYRPRADLSREAFVKLLVSAEQAEGGPSNGRIPPDVARDRWSASYIAAAFDRDWLGSLLDSEGRFHPSRTITRQEVAMLIGVSQLEKLPAEQREAWLAAGWLKERDSRAFGDAASIAADMQPFVYYASRLGIMEGDNAGFKPEEPLIRKQAAAVIYRLLDSRLAERKVDFTGYYAIESYPAIGHMDKLSDVILGWSHLQYDGAGSGSAKLNTSQTEYKVPDGFGEVVEAADQAGASKELMVFSAASDLKDFLKDRPAREAFIDSLLATLNDPAYAFTGVQIDFEGLKETGSAAGFTSFLEELKERLGTLTLSVAVPPIYYYGGYDLKAIGRLADTVVLMAYDFTHAESRLPSAPLPLVNETVVTALKAIPKEKLVLGVSKQANQWITAPNGVVGPVYKPRIADVEKRLAMPGVKTSWSTPHLLRQAEFTDERGSHLIYYEDAQSIDKKIWLAKYYELKGVSLWHMGNFTAEDWALIGRHAS